MISLGAVAGLTPFGLTKAAVPFAPARVGGGFFWTTVWKTIRVCPSCFLCFGLHNYYISNTKRNSKMITVTANIPARTVSGRTYNAHTKTFQQDDAGQWFIDFCGDWEKVSEAEVVDVCERATNWPSIKAAHFQMVGFHA